MPPAIFFQYSQPNGIGVVSLIDRYSINRFRSGNNRAIEAELIDYRRRRDSPKKTLRNLSESAYWERVSTEKKQW